MADTAEQHEQQQSSRSWLRYWPAALFTVCSLGVWGLTRTARGFNERAAQLQEQYQADHAWRDDEPTSEFNSLGTTARDSGQAAMLFDFGQQPEQDLLAQHHSSGGLALFDRLNDGLDNLKSKTADLLEQQRRKEREAKLLQEPVRFNFYSSAGSYLGQRSYLPPLNLDVPPIPISPMTLDTAGLQARLYSGGERNFNVVVDPALFKDERAMRDFVARLTLDLVTAGLQPEIRIQGKPGTTAPGPTTGIPSTLPPVLPLPPGTVQVASNLTLDQPLPKPPSDVVKGVDAPSFDPKRLPGGVSAAQAPPNVPKIDATPPAAPDHRPLTDTVSPTTGRRPVVGPLRDTAPAVAAPQPKPAPRAQPKPNNSGEIELDGSDAKPAATKPAAQPKPAAPEPQVALRIRLAATPDEAAAKHRLEQLQEAGLGGSLRKSSDGLDYWIVQSKVLTRRSEALQALARVRAMGYEAWLN